MDLDVETIVLIIISHFKKVIVFEMNFLSDYYF